MTKRGREKTSQSLHSRLEFTPDGRHLLSAGWVWHPLGVLSVFDVTDALRMPSVLDRAGVFDSAASSNGGVESAAFEGADCVVMYVDPDEENLGHEDEERLQPGELGRWSLGDKRWITRARMGERHLGRLMPLGREVLGFYEHPTLVDSETGVVLAEWPDLKTGLELSSFCANRMGGSPPLALDPQHARFAVADATGITVVELV